MTTRTDLWAYHPDAGRWSAGSPCSSSLRFHRSLPGYRVTSLREVATLAAAAGVGSCWVKDESDRLGLPAFKVLGASWAISCALSGRDGAPAAGTLAELRSRLTGEPATLVTATDGNHGRAVAWTARLLGLRARVYVAAGVGAAARNAIAAERAEVVSTELVYDEAVALAAQSCQGRSDQVLVQDTSWPGYTTIPQRIVDGYQTLFCEIDDQLGGDRPDLVVVPTGVGSLLQAALEHYRAPDRAHRPAVLAVEPLGAACVTRSLAADTLITVDTSTPTILAGLNCGSVSANAWPAIRHGLDAAVAVTEDEVRRALVDLAAAGAPAGPCGAAALAGLRAVTDDPDRREQLSLGPRSRVVLVSTEGVAANPVAGMQAS